MTLRTAPSPGTPLLLAVTVFVPPVRGFLALALPPDRGALLAPLVATLALFGLLQAIKPLWAGRLRS